MTANALFILSIFCFIISLLVSLREIMHSLKALDIEMQNAVQDNSITTT